MDDTRTRPDRGVRTGITYDTDDNVEEVDRSYIALEFKDGDTGADALGDVDTDNVTVVGQHHRRRHPPEQGARDQPEPGPA